MKEKILNNLSLKIISVLMAVILWFVVVNVDDSPISKKYSKIQVIFINESVLYDKNETYSVIDNSNLVDVTVTADRSYLKNLTSGNIMVYADFNNLSSDGKSIPLDVRITNSASTSTLYTSVDPENVTIKIKEK